MSDSLANFSMFELFKAEAEMHCATLNQGLLAIEADPADVSHVEALMRAAHSIKGAARIIGFDLAVKLAHAMEDCFLAVQKGSERLTSGRVDQLLKGVDRLAQVATLTEDQVSHWSTEHSGSIEALTHALRAKPPAEPAAPHVEAPAPDAVRHAVEPAAPAATPPAPGPSAEQRPPGVADVSKPGKGEAAPEEAVVKVNARSLNRIMQLASESMIASRHFQGLQQASQNLRDANRRLAKIAREAVGPKRERNGRADLTDAVRQLAATTERLLQEHFAELERVVWRSEKLSTALYHEVLGSRMRPFADGVAAFPRMVRDLARSLGKRIALNVVGETVPVDRDILRKLEAPLNHLLRNCVDHGIEPPDLRRAAGKPEQGQIMLEARHHAGMLTVQIRDDGKGIDPEAVRRRVIDRKLADESMVVSLSHAELFEFLFLPGFSTAAQVTEVSGRGVGLDVVQSMVQEVSGTVRVESEPGRSTTFTLHLPVTLSVIRAALTEIAGELYAFPLARLVRILHVAREDIKPVEGRQQFRMDGESVGLVSTAEVLGFGAAPPSGDAVSVMVIGPSGQYCGLAVDRFVGEQDLVVRPLDGRLGNVPHISAAAVLETGEPVLIVDVEDLFHSVRQLLGEGRLRGVRSLGIDESARAKRRLLVVDDSITVREVERQLLRKHGYEVDVAVDGRDGWNALRAGPYDLLITDVDMPRMNGIELIRTVRQDRRFTELPIIIVSYKEREEDRLLGMEAGANAYLTKGSFHDDSLVTTVADLIGGP